MAGHNRVDVARLAAVTSAPDIRRASAREVRDLTGFSIGGIPPIGHAAADPGDHGPRPRPLPGRLGRRRPVDDGLPGPARDAARSCPTRRVAPIAEERTAAEREAAGDRGQRRRRVAGLTHAPGVTAEPRNATIAYPGGLRARWRWGGSGSAAAVFALSEAGGALIDLGPTVAADPDALCRAELRLEGPRGAWTARFASLIHDEPRALHWDTAGLLVVAYGFHTYGLETATGEPRWDHRSATPLLALLGSSRLAHVIVQSEIETFAIEPDGTVAWRVAHSDVVTAAELVGGRLVADRVRRPGHARSTRRRAGPRPDEPVGGDVDGRWITAGSDRETVDDSRLTHRPVAPTVLTSPERPSVTNG